MFDTHVAIFIITEPKIEIHPFSITTYPVQGNVELEPPIQSHFPSLQITTMSTLFNECLIDIAPDFFFFFFGGR